MNEILFNDKRVAITLKPLNSPLCTAISLIFLCNNIYLNVECTVQNSISNLFRLPLSFYNRIMKYIFYQCSITWYLQICMTVHFDDSFVIFEYRIGLVYVVRCHFQHHFSYIMAVSFICGGNKSMGEIHRPVASHGQALSQNVVSSSPHHEHCSNSQHQ